MGYTTNRSRTSLGPRGLGDVASTVTAATAIVTDPYLPEVTRLVLRLHDLEQPGGKPSSGGAGGTPGIGLRFAVKPLRAAVYVRERPWIIPVGGLAIVGGLVGLGYLIGKGRI